MQQVIIEGDNLQVRTAESATTLAKLRGIEATVVWDSEARQYVVNGEPCGPSVHGVLEWFDKQKGAKT